MRPGRQSLWRAGAAVLAFLGWAAAPPAGARVFLPGGSAGADPAAVVSPVELPAYRANLQLNGGAGVVEVRPCPGSVADALEKLMRSYRERGALAFCSAGKQLGWGVVLYEGRVIRLLATSAGRRNTCLLFRFDQAKQDFSRAAEAPPGLPPDWPSYPGSRVTRWLRNEATGTSLVLAKVRAEIPEVQDFYFRALSGAGWAPALGPRDQTSGVYLKGSEMMCVHVVSTGLPGQCVITLLHRRLKSKPDA